jgi:tRNA pseudouridine38-40 synthase
LGRYKLTIQYDGSSFFGWQLQKNERTVQGEIEKGIQIISQSSNRITLHGAGRTDTGVHARAQVAHVDLETRLNIKELKNALNGNIDKDCRIMDIEKIHDDFQARFDAKKRYYKYQCYVGESILYHNQAWIGSNLNLDCLNELASQIVGDHDFLSFSKFREDMKNTRCLIYKSEWKSEGKMVIFRIVGNRFLHHMVRYLVGSMVAVNNERFSKDEFLSLLRNPQKDVRIFKAPAQGLILEKVEYE